MIEYSSLRKDFTRRLCIYMYTLEDLNIVAKLELDLITDRVRFLSMKRDILIIVMLVVIILKPADNDDDVQLNPADKWQ